MNVSDNGYNFIKAAEGFEDSAYRLNDEKFWTIGYGHTGPEVKRGSKITKPGAHALLVDRINREFLPGVLQALDILPNQNELDAFVSLAYNIGVQAFKNSTAVKRWNTGHKSGCAEAMKWWNKVTVDGVRIVSDGLVKRREAEVALFNTPVRKVHPAHVEETAASIDKPEPLRSFAMNERDLGFVLVGAAIPVLLPIVLSAVSKGVASVDTRIDQEPIIKQVVDEFLVPLVKRAVDEVEVDRSEQPAA